MLTKLPNGTYADLSTATIIDVCKKTVMSVTGTVIPDMVILKWVGNNRNEMRCQTIAIKFDSLDEAYAETDRLAAIANSQRSNGAILINNAYYRCSDVQSVDIVSTPLSWVCRVHLTGDHREDIWFDAPKGLSGDELALQLTACEAEAHEYARTLMERVAGAERGRE